LTQNGKSRLGLYAPGGILMHHANRTGIRATALGLLILTLVTNCQAQTAEADYYVAPGGNDAKDCRSAYRGRIDYEVRYADYGFRVVLVQSAR